MEILILALLILSNGFLALSEIALVSSKKARLEQRRAEGSRGARVALRLRENSEHFLSAIQVGITLIGILTGVYSGTRIADDIAPVFLAIAPIAPWAQELSLALTVLIITYVSIVIGELVPKTVALSNPERIAIRVAPPIHFLSQAFYPFVQSLSLSTSFINRAIGIEKRSDQLTEAELRQMMRIATSEGVIEREQNIIHERVFYFSDKRARHIMTHRIDVEWIDIDRPLDDLREALLTFQHSKVICCRGGLDNFVGILVLNPLLRALASGQPLDLAALTLEPTIVPESADAQSVLTLMRRDKTQICCVVNELGGFEGIITLHDILEHLVGQMPSEGEAFDPDVFVREDRSVLVSGDAPIDTLNEVIQGFSVDLERIGYSTVAGFVIDRFGRIPGLGDQVEYEGYRIEIIDLDGNKIDKVLISKI